jgi:hypothetical protein
MEAAITVFGEPGGKQMRTRYEKRQSHSQGARTETTVGKPFKMERDEDNRRFVRLDISAPVAMYHLKDGEQPLTPPEHAEYMEAMLLNISAGGVLVELERELTPGDVVCMRFTLQDVEAIDHVLGLVKRCDRDEEVFLAGVEFTSREHLADILSGADMEMLPEQACSFHERAQLVLEKYVQSEA